MARQTFMMQDRHSLHCQLSLNSSKIIIILKHFLNFFCEKYRDDEFLEITAAIFFTQSFLFDTKLLFTFDHKLLVINSVMGHSHLHVYIDTWRVHYSSCFMSLSLLYIVCILY